MTDSTNAPDVVIKRQERWWLSIFSTQTFTLIVGVVVMVLILFCNNWIIRAQSVFSNLARVNSTFDNFDHTELVAMYNLCGQTDDTFTQSDLARMIQIGRTIQIHDALLAEAQDTAHDLNTRLNLMGPDVPTDTVREYLAVGQIGSWGGPNPLSNTVGRSPELSAKLGATEADVTLTQGTEPVGTIANLATPPTEKQIVCNNFLSNPSGLIQQYNVWRASLKGFSAALEIGRTQPMFTGKGPGTNLVLEHQLQANMTIITHWWLPILNGALGAIIFCLTRMLKNRATAPKLGEIVLRMVFGGFAGLLVSILLLPSGVAFGQFVGNAPGVSLLAFVFGFSLDSFIQLLERMNQLVMDSTRPKEPKG